MSLDQVTFFDINRIRQIEEEASTLGFRLGASKHHGQATALFPDGENFPIFVEDTQFFTGTLPEIASFLKGFNWARNYDRLLKLTTDEKRQKKEQVIRNQKLIDLIERSEGVPTEEENN